MNESKPNYSQARCDLHPEHPQALLFLYKLRGDDGGEAPQPVTAVSAKFPVAIGTSQRRMGIGQSTVIRKPWVRGAQLTATLSRLWLFYRPGMASRMSVQSMAALRCNRGRRGNDAQSLFS
jgi:hypothetical protein